MKGTVKALAYRPGKMEAMAQTESLNLTETNGVDEDYGSSRKRQVTLLSWPSWHAMETEFGREVPWTTRRANVLIDGLEFADVRGFDVKIGETILEILGETVPCQAMDDQVLGLQEQLKPNRRGGVYGRVKRAGQIRVGDTVEIA